MSSDAKDPGKEDGQRNERPIAGAKEDIPERRQRKLTEKGKAYQLAEKMGERKKRRREIQMQIANTQTLMGLDRNLELVSEESLKLNRCFQEFGNLHEEIQELLTEEEQSLDTKIYDNLSQEIVSFRDIVQKWMTDVDRRNKEQSRIEMSSIRSAKSRSSAGYSHRSTASSKARALEAKAKCAELEARIAEFDKVEAAKRKAERARLMADCVAAAAVRKVYDDAISDDEQDLGSDDPDIDYAHSMNEFPHLKSRLNPEAQELTEIPPPKIKNHKIAAVDRGVTRHAEHSLGPVYSAELAKVEPQAAFWEKMELRMSRPPPEPTPFDGDPARYLRFRANFRDQVESKASLTDSEKMSYLMSYTTGTAKKVIENYQGLPNGCELALQVLKQRFGQNAMIVQALKSSVIGGPRIRAGDSTALLALSDKVENCCWAMIELQSNELDCTTNMRQIYDRLPESLQRKWRKSAKAYRERTNGKEPTLKELSKFIAEKAQTENDPVYGKSSISTATTARYPSGNNPKKSSFSRTSADTRITTLATQILPEEDRSDRGANEPMHTKEVQGDKSHHSPIEACKVCNRSNHETSKCFIFSSKSLNWRRRFAKFNKLCYRCLATSHLRGNCPEKNGCKEKNCTSPMSHHSLLHTSKTKEVPEVQTNTSRGTAPVDDTHVTVHKATMEDVKRSFVLLKVVPVRVTAENGAAVTTYGLLDTAAVSSMITSDLAGRLQLQGVPEKVNINTVTHNNHECELFKVKFEISSTNQDGLSFPVHHALAVDDLNVSDRYCPNQLDLTEWPHLEEFEIPNVAVDINAVSVLIGQDVPQAHIVLDYCWGDDPQRQPYATKTPFGWCVAGPTGRSEDYSKPIGVSVFKFDWAQDKSDMKLSQQVEKFWASEMHGFGNADESADSVEDKQALAILEATTKLKDGRYEVGLLWRNNDPHLPNNRIQAEKRLRQLKKRFIRDPVFAEQYRRVMNDYTSKGYAKRLPDEEATRTSNNTWYLPHHGVINPNKSKIRVVYDAAAEYGGTSLNKELLQGPQLNNSLIGVLLRFRRERVAVAADIESMFHRVVVREEDTDALRFLWWSESSNDPPSDHKMTVHLFGKADSPCIAAWALQQTAADNKSDFEEEVSRAVFRNFYVDDCLFSVPEKGQAIRSSIQLGKLLRRGNFRLTKFVSNEKDVLAAIPAEERTIKNLDLDKLPIERALGLQWDIENDTFGVKVSLPPKQLDNSRRGCLSFISSTFDPFGMVAPVLLPAKRVMQKTWQLKLQWDDELPGDLLEGWKTWKEDLPLLNQATLPRCYFDNGCSTDASFQLHHFSDASEFGYGTVSYLRKEAADGTVECAFIMAKSRTAPLQYVSTPRLELQAATIAVRVHRLILKEIDLNISSTFFWTDSRITLQYINNESRRFKTYVANRVAEIRNASQPSQWRHCPGPLNPSDDASRGLSVHKLLTSDRWFKGPAFLRNPEEEWPSAEVNVLPEDDTEIKADTPVFTLTEPDKLHEILLKYSSWSVLQRKVAWLLKFKAYLQRRSVRSITRSDHATYLTTSDLERSTVAIVKLVQEEAYAEEIKALRKHGYVKGSSKIVKLRPVLSDGVLRVGGRIAEAPITFGAKFPMIVPPKHHVTQILIASFHQKLAHAGQNHILSQMREQFWIPRGRSAVRKVVRSCLTCKKQRAANMEQMMAALPVFRTTAYEPCFAHTGVDYFGPLQVKRGRAVVKRWGAIFTCLNSRALHLEVASSLEADCFINVLRRFMNRRGPPKVIYSDNGTNFVGAEREIREAIEGWNQDHIRNELLQKGCQWVFQPPKASHASGVWERLIRSTRTALKAILGEGLADEDVVATVFTEVESVLNSRPLCAVSDDPNDCEPLTPNHLLLQRPVNVLPPGSFVKEDIYCRKKWRQTQILANHFWKRWLKEYIPALQERQKWCRPRRNAEVGDLVLLIDECLPRGQWHLGRIVKVITGRDGLVRTVEVKTRTTKLVRPVQKLCLLEEASNLCRDAAATKG